MNTVTSGGGPFGGGHRGGGGGGANDTCSVQHYTHMFASGRLKNVRPKICKMVNGFWYYRALESVSIASALSAALTIYLCQIRVHQRWQSKLQLPTARKKEWRPATADSSPHALTCQHCDTHYFSRPRTRNLPIVGWFLVRRSTSSAADSPELGKRRTKSQGWKMTNHRHWKKAPSPFFLLALKITGIVQYSKAELQKWHYNKSTRL